MKIKDCVVVDTTLIHNIIIKLDRYGYEKLANALDNNIKPLEPIIRDAYLSGYVDEDKSLISEFLNETDI
jgi:hypothetical protein